MKLHFELEVLQNYPDDGQFSVYGSLNCGPHLISREHVFATYSSKEHAESELDRMVMAAEVAAACMQEVLLDEVASFMVTVEKFSVHRNNKI